MLIVFLQRVRHHDTCIDAKDGDWRIGDDELSLYGGERGEGRLVWMGKTCCVSSLRAWRRKEGA